MVLNQCPYTTDLPSEGTAELQQVSLENFDKTKPNQQKVDSNL